MSIRSHTYEDVRLPNKASTLDEFGMSIREKVVFDHSHTPADKFTICFTCDFSHQTGRNRLTCAFERCSASLSRRLSSEEIGVPLRELRLDHLKTSFVVVCINLSRADWLLSTCHCVQKIFRFASHLAISTPPRWHPHHIVVHWASSQ